MITTTQTPARPKSRLRGVLRVALYLACVAAVSGAWLSHRVHAELERHALTLGREIELSLGKGAPDGATSLRVNGQLASLHSSVLNESVDSVIARFAERCSQDSGGLDQELKQAVADAQRASRAAGGGNLALPTKAPLGMFQTEPGKREATAACFARPHARQNLAGLMRDVERLVETGDLSALGQFRYVYARPAQGGKGTHVIAVWSEGAIKLEEMFPETGDAAGVDLVAGVRPPNATRRLSAESLGKTYQMALYESDVEVGQALAGYERALVKAGYQPSLEPAVTAAQPVPLRAYRRGDADEIIVLAERASGKTLVAGFRPGTHGAVSLSMP